MPEEAIEGRLVRADLLRSAGGRLRTTRRWQSAMARAAGELYGQKLPFDLRLPIAMALTEIFGAELPSDELVELIDAMLPIELAELEPLRATAR
jgi:hypothetical protein